MDKKFKVIVVVVLGVLSIATVVSTVTAVNATQQYNKYIKENNLETEVDEADKRDIVDSSNIEIMSLAEPITSNINGKSGGIARVSVSFGVDTKSKEYKEFSTNFEAKQPLIRDEIIRILRYQNHSDMSKPDAPDYLSDIMRDKINILLDTEVIKEVIFGEFFVQ